MPTSKATGILSKLVFHAVLVLAMSLGAINALGQKPPLVYDTENTGANFPKPDFPPYDQLPIIQLLPDPFARFDGSGRDTRFASWERRRNEIKAAIEKYEIGPKPDRSDLVINAVYAPGTSVLTVTVTRLTNGQSLALNVPISLPAGPAPAAGWPAVIRMALAPNNSPVSSTIAGIDYLHDDVTQYAAGQQFSHAADPYFRMYPEYDAGCNSVNYQPYGPCPAVPGKQLVGQYSAWSWGVSRLIDGLEIATKQAVNPLPVDLKHLGVNGCSYAGKMALFAGAFDERIAATFAQESGGGGAPAWRVSHGIEPEGTVEKTNNTDGSWFINSMKSDFGRDNVYKLPEDHHMLAAMVAPRALMLSGNTDFVWLSNRSTYITSKAVEETYDTFGIGDRFGFWIDGGHGHCALGAGEQPQIDAFYKKFLLGDNTVNWDIHVYPQTSAFTDLDYRSWFQWWADLSPTPPNAPIEQLVNSLVMLHVSNPSSSGAITAVNLAITNTSTDTIFAPLRVEVAQLNSTSGSITVANADNSLTGAGATWDYKSKLGADNALTANETSSARNLRFNNPRNEPFTVTFNVIAYAPPSNTSEGSASAGTHSAASGSSGSGTSSTSDVKSTMLSLTYHPLLNSFTLQVVRSDFP